jgi:uncharacterized protein (DUF1330 family)
MGQCGREWRHPPVIASRDDGANPEGTMAKGYLIAQVEVHDPEAYQEYGAKVPATLVGFDGRFLVRGGRIEPLEGDPPPQRTVVLEFPSLAHARDWYESDAYQALIPLRHAAAVTRNFLVEGPD